MRPPRQHANLHHLTTYGRSRAVRLPECDYAGNEIIHVTVCARCGEPFRDHRLAQQVCESVEFYCRKLRYRLFGYCLMPDHLHALLSPDDSGRPLAKWLLAFKNYTGRMFANSGGTPPLWQRSAYDHVCREGETAEGVLAYIVNNAVRRGYVGRWQEWPWTRVFIEM